MTDNNQQHGQYTGWAQPDPNQGGQQGQQYGDQGGFTQPVPPVQQPAQPAQTQYEAPAAPAYPAPAQPAYQAPQPPAYPAPAQPSAPAYPAPGVDPYGAAPYGAGAYGQDPYGAAAGAQPPATDPNHDPNYVFADRMKTFTTTVVLPAHSLNFNEAHFINLLAGSISLTRDEKKKIIDSMPTLRQAQVDELIRIFEEERAKFIELSPKHGSQLKKLEDEHQADWKDIEMSYKQNAAQQKDEADADEIRKQLGL